MFLSSISRLRGFRVTVSKKRKKLITSRGVFVPNFRSVSYFFWSGGGDQVKDTEQADTLLYEGNRNILYYLLASRGF